MGAGPLLPMMASCPLAHPELAFSRPCLTSPSPTCAAWGHLPNKLLALESLLLGFLVEQLNPRQWLKALELHWSPW